jgi:hypothetical protein
MMKNIDKPEWSNLLNRAVSEPGSISEAYSRFWHYSVSNQMLALMQCRSRKIEPGPIASYKAWQRQGRQGQKGQKAIALLMPIVIKSKDDKGKPEDEAKRRIIFIMRRNWFVLSQTEGDEYTPEPIPDWDLSRALGALDITEEPFEHMDGNAQGYARKRTIAVSSIAAMPYKTRFHELAHITLGHTAQSAYTDSETPSRSLAEAEAESVALICCESLGLPGAKFSRGYIQGWLAGETIPDRSAQRIFSAADKILKAGLPLKKEVTQ